MKNLFLKLFIPSLFLCLAAPAFGQSVVKKMKRKGRYLIQIDVGKLNGYIKGTKVCFYNSKGKKVACGKIVYAKNEISRIKVKKSRYKRVKKGMEAKADAVDTVASAIAASSGVDARTNFKALYAFTPLPVTSFNKVSYKAPPSNGNKVDSLWGKSEDSGMQEIGLGLEFEVGVGSSQSIAFGLRYKIFREFLVDSDYDEANKDLYADTNIKAASLGLWLDYYLLHSKMSDNFYLKVPVGLDFDQTDLVIVSDRLSDNESDSEFNIVDAKSNLTLLSLRTGAHFAFVLAPIGFSFGLNLLIPLAEASRSIEGNSDDTNGPRLDGKDQIDDLDAALAMDKASVGAEIIISTFIVF